MANVTRMAFSAPTAAELYNTMYNTANGINIIIILIIIQLFICTVLKGIYIKGHLKNLKKLSLRPPSNKFKVISS